MQSKQSSNIAAWSGGVHLCVSFICHIASTAVVLVWACSCHCHNQLADHLFPFLFVCLSLLFSFPRNCRPFSFCRACPSSTSRLDSSCLFVVCVWVTWKNGWFVSRVFDLQVLTFHTLQPSSIYLSAKTLQSLRFYCLPARFQQTE